MNLNRLRERPPASLGSARVSAHKAVQLLSKAALANLEPKPDYSHDNMGWDDELGALLIHPIPTQGRSLTVGLVLNDLDIVVVENRAVLARFGLDGASSMDAESWLDQQLIAAGLKNFSNVALPYELPPEVTNADYSASPDDLAVLAEWFSFGHRVLSNVVNRIGHPADASPVRCWPHHFDIGSFVALDGGDPETAAGIGLGMATGDEHYTQPYFYISFYPQPETAFPVPAPGHWHTVGFTGVVATGDEILSLDDLESGAAEFVQQSFDTGRSRLGF